MATTPRTTVARVNHLTPDDESPTLFRGGRDLNTNTVALVTRIIDSRK